MKYRLIKAYPMVGITEGKIVEKTEDETYITEGRFIAFNSCEVENYPEFWEKVEEKGYVVLKRKVANPLQVALCDIIIVKRLSDGEIFEVGDVTNFGKIIKIYEAENTVFIQRESDKMNTPLSEIKHKKKPILVTEDGVEIFDPNIVLYTYSTKGKSDYCAVFAKDTDKSISTYKWFSTSEARNKYAEENKKQYSIKDIKEAYNNVYGDEGKYGALLYHLGNLK